MNAERRKNEEYFLCKNFCVVSLRYSNACYFCKNV